MANKKLAKLTTPPEYPKVDKRSLRSLLASSRGKIVKETPVEVPSIKESYQAQGGLFHDYGLVKAYSPSTLVTPSTLSYEASTMYNGWYVVNVGGGGGGSLVSPAWPSTSYSTQIQVSSDPYGGAGGSLKGIVSNENYTASITSYYYVNSITASDSHWFVRKYQGQATPHSAETDIPDIET